LGVVNRAKNRFQKGGIHEQKAKKNDLPGAEKTRKDLPMRDVADAVAMLLYGR
jgi:hypothetical protein